MKTIDRRDFLKIAGAGTVAAAAGAVIPITGFFAWVGKEGLRFRAVTGMPRSPWPAYASYVIEGNVDLRSRSGQLAKSIHAGAPDAMSGIVFPGTARSIRVLDVQKSGSTIEISGEIVEKSLLLPGESPTIKIQIDQTAGVARADFLGSNVVMRLDE
ncbi:MAG TPA: twin-arginine translocation signal domain-containing protein [Nitrospira sp.]|nr:twin-arginine translocation signal domain-containing protein [Nitrospira sp.]